MLTWLADLFRGEGFMPHGHCYFWRPDIVFLHVASDGLIGLAYFAIPLGLLRFVRRRRDLPYSWILWCFGGLIVSCGLTHVLEIITLWHPAYWISGTMKAVTAVASLTTAVVLFRLIPLALALPSPADLRAAHDALALNEARFRAAAEGSLDAFFILECVRDAAGAIVDFRYVDVNARGAAMDARPRNSMVGALLGALGPSPERHSGFDRYVRVVETREPYEGEDRVPRDGGEARWLFTQVVPLADGVAVTARDVTERQRVQRALELQDAIVRNMAEGVCLVRADDGVIVYANPTFGAMFGYAPAELEGMAVSRLNRDDGTERALAATERIRGQVRAEGVATYEVENVRKDGTPFWCRATTSLLAHPDHGSVLVAVQQDITAAKRAAIESARLAAIVESSDNAIMSVTLEGSLDSWNKGATRLYGYEATEMVGRPLSMLVPPNGGDEASDLLGRVARGERVERFETVRQRKDGSRVEVSLSLSPIHGPDGRVVGASALTEDITARKDVERRLRASLAEKVVLLQEVHHRVKNNLQVISSLLSLQGRYLSDPRARAVLLDSQQRVRSIALLHESLYQSPDLARLDVGQYLHRLGASLVRTYSVGAPPRLQIQTEPVDVDLDAAVPLGLIVNELVTNALKYAFPDGRAGTLWLTLGPTPRGGFCLTVADDGVGLPPDFDPHTAPSLGLHIVHTLSDQLGGTLARGPGPGTTFELRVEPDVRIPTVLPKESP